MSPKNRSRKKYKDKNEDFTKQNDEIEMYFSHFL